MHSEKELRDKLINKGHSQEDIDTVLLELADKDYLNDKTFAQQVISDEINFKKNGPVLIANKLLKKGVEMALVSSLLTEFYDEEHQYQNCRYMANKKLKSLNNDDGISKKNKLGSFLVQKGFPWDMINRIFLEFEII